MSDFLHVLLKGNIQFDTNGTCIQHILRLKQYRRENMGFSSNLSDIASTYNVYGNLIISQVANFNALENYTFRFESGFSDRIIYPS